MMKRVFFVLALVAMVTLASRVMIEDTSFERSEDFNRDWKFSLVDDPSSLKYSEVSFDDSHWTETILPHDWSIGLAYDTTNADGATGYAPGGTGWYRKKFTKEINDDQKVYVYFDGIYNNSEVWINGEHLGFHPYGYSPFYYEITDQLNDDGTDNVITFKVDRTRYVDSRWYTGSGIYRNVDLITTHKLHIPIWGTFITTAGVSADQATVNVELTVQNDRSDEQSFDLVTEIFDANAGRVAIIKETKILSAASNLVLNHQAVLKNPKLWDLDDPNLYSAVTSIIQDDMVVDHYTIRFGIRDVRFDPDDGFFLNGENMKIKGVCLHHDGGLVGAAVPKDVWKRRLNTLKEGGTNAIRIAHNPASQELLELCDEMGILVQDEFFDEWDYPKDKRLNQQERHDDYHSRGYAEHFQEWAEKDLKSVMKAHRNNPSVFQWSIGNEIEWTYHPRYRNITGYFNMNWQGNYFWDPPPLTIEQIRERHKDIAPRKYELAKTAMKLSKWTKEMDTTRVVTANLILPSASHETGYTEALDVVGYSYRRVLYDYGHENYPDKPIMGTENLGQWHEWKSVIDRPFISGVFLWTGIDYLGESHAHWPRKAQPSGLLDIAGYPKGSYHMMKSLWVDEPHIHIATQT
ncbi:MAG: glycoside hydrolase family 2 TIM barrel-domain containing protein, partial [Bacteroidota bacterium]